jgi:hypothetical protein
MLEILWKILPVLFLCSLLASFNVCRQMPTSSCAACQVWTHGVQHLGACTLCRSTE